VTDDSASRPFTWDDLPRLHELTARRSAVEAPGAQMHIGEIYWVLRDTSSGSPLGDARVWLAADSSLAAFAWLDPPVLGDLIVTPDSGERLLDAVLRWLEEESRAQARSAIAVVAMDDDAPRVEALRRRGYARGESGNVRFWRSLTPALPAAALPASFSMRGVFTEEDIERRVFVESSAFGGSVTGDAWRSFVRRSPRYRPELDVLVVAPDGAGASAATSWYDDATRCGELEAVGTAAAYRRMGLAKAVVIEELRLLQELGATQVVVQTTIGNEPATALYRSCGFAFVAEDPAWTKQL
jgi:GNAT superfamily N-acetyltransferase